MSAAFIVDIDGLDIWIEPSPIWVTANKIKIPVTEMSSEHIRNVINCWNGQGKVTIPPTYLGGKEKWLKIFSEELTRRQ